MKFYTAYGERAPKVQYIPGKSRTKQSMKKETDINFIVDKYQKTGTLEHLKNYEGTYGEFVEIDFHQAMNTITKANEMFETLPSNIRAKFENDPGAFLEFATTKENHLAMVELGLAYPLPHEPVEEPVVAPEPALEPDPTVTT